MVWLDTPRPARDRSCRVHDREVDLPVRGDAVEERRTVGRRLGEDRRDANGRPRVVRGRQPTQPALGLASCRAGVAACAPSADDVRRKPRVEPECVSGDPCACRAGGGLCDPHEVAGGAGPEVGSRPLLECIDEPEVGVDRGVDIVRRDPLADTDPPCELHLRGGQPRCDSADHPSRDPELAFALELSTPLRRLLVDERGRGRADQAGCRPRPRRAGATRARNPRSPRSSCRTGAHGASRTWRSTRTVGWKNGELKSAAHLTSVAPTGIACNVPTRPASSSRTADPTTAAGGAAWMRASWRSSRRGMATSSASRRATYVPRASSSPRFSEPARPTCSSLRSTRRRVSSTLREDLRRRVGGRVVDDHDLEIRDGLTEDARERSPDVFLAVVDGEERGDERGGRHYVP